jgi:hypothetical protein
VPGLIRVWLRNQVSGKIGGGLRWAHGKATHTAMAGPRGVEKMKLTGPASRETGF